MYPQVILFGDSLIEQGYKTELNGWIASVSNYYARQYDVLNRGFSGYNSRYADIILPYVIPANQCHSISIVVIFFGANDATLPFTNRPVCCSVEEYKQHLRNMIQYISSCRYVDNSVPPIVLITPPPVVDNLRDHFCRNNTQYEKTPGDRINAYTEVYANACLHVQKELKNKKIFVLDIYHEMMKSSDWHKYLDSTDGLHLSSEGNQFIYYSFISLIEQQITDIRKDEKNYMFPIHHKITIDNAHEILLENLIFKGNTEDY